MVSSCLGGVGSVCRAGQCVRYQLPPVHLAVTEEICSLANPNGMCSQARQHAFDPARMRRHETLCGAPDCGAILVGHDRYRVLPERFVPTMMANRVLAIRESSHLRIRLGR